MSKRLARIDLVACDLDGTLLDSRNRIPDDVRASLHDLLGIGIRVVLASGRTDGFTRACAQHIAPGIPVISLNGALVMDSEKHVVSMRPLPQQTWNIISPVLERHPDLSVSVFTPDGILSERRDPRLPGYLNTSDSPVEHVADIQYFTERGVTMCIAGSYPAVQACSVALAQKLSRRVERLVYPSGSGSLHYLEVRPSGVTKASALRTLLRRYGIPRSRSAAIGDYSNDIEMCTLVAVSAAMRNGIDSLKDRADMITRATNADGGAKEFFRLILEHKGPS